MRESFEMLRQIALGQVPRALGLGDRDPSSETYGCFDRMYWHYKLIDFPNARFQEVCWLLALLYSQNFEGNSYYQNEKVKEWVGSAIRFWAGIRHRDGSVDEAYPNERGFCATAFSTFAVTEAMLLLGHSEPSLENTGKWLSSHDAVAVSNQTAAAALALLNLYQLTREKRYLHTSREKISDLLSRQDATGYFPEYGGADIGYHSLTLAILCRYWKRTKEIPLEEPIRRGIRFLEERIDETGNYDYRQTSRKTQFLYSYGLCGAERLLGHLTAGLERGVVLNPAWMDDRYFIQLTTDYLETYLFCRSKESLAGIGQSSWGSS